MAETDTPSVPTAEEQAAAREVLNRAALASADPARAAMIGLVTSEPFNATFDMMIAAQSVNRSDGQLAYAITMFEQLRTTFTPA